MEIINKNLPDFLLGYDTFIIDVYQTIYDSSGVLIPGVQENLELLAKKNKRVIIFTNLPLNNQKTFDEPFFEQCKEWGFEFYTSGEICRQILSKKNYKNYFLFGCRELQGYVNVSPLQADFIYLDLPALPKNLVKAEDGIIIEKFPEVVFSRSISLFRPFLQELVANGKTIFSGKPCIDASMEIENFEVISNQAIVEEYRRLGGEAIEIGKPYLAAYQSFINDKNQRILCIGDTMETDIKGAFELWLAGYDANSLLVLTGETKLFELTNYNYKPDFATPSLGRK